MVDEVSAPIKPKRKIGCWTLGLIVVGVLVLIGLMVPRSPSTAPVTAEGKPVEPIDVTARALFDAYQANEAAAQKKYGTGPVRISGTIQSIDLDFANKPVVRLQTGNQFMAAGLSLTEAAQAKADALSKGAQLTATCLKVSELAGTPMLSDCSF